MAAPFPLSPVPNYFSRITPGQPMNVFYENETNPFVVLQKAGASQYVVRDYYGDIVSTGAVSGVTVTPTLPEGGWKLGWYRIYFTGSSTDAIFGSAYGATNFIVIRRDSRFPEFASGGTDLSSRNVRAKAALGMGTSRLSISNANTPTSGDETITLIQTAADLGNQFWTVAEDSPYYDPGRTRHQWVNFPNRAYDVLTVGGLNIYSKDSTIDGSTVTIEVTDGSLSGAKITVNTEVYDNLVNLQAATAALSNSALVRGFGSGSVGRVGSTVLGKAYFDGVKQVVAELYPSGIRHFEGPINEPSLGSECAHQMMLFQAAVHAGHPDALAIGPCPVALDVIDGSGWNDFLAAGGGQYCDEISFHAYNAITNGDINLGRLQTQAFIDLLAKYNLQDKPLWQTESTQAMIPVYGVYHPRRSRVPLIQTFLLEQYGIPREKNNYWYDVSHGFWAYPAWWMNRDESLQPLCALYRVLAEETFNRPYNSPLHFGEWGDRIFLGNVYKGEDGTAVAAIQTMSYMPDSTVTLEVIGGVSTLTAVDGFGNPREIIVTDGWVTIAVEDIPSYVRLPAGVDISVFACNDWPPITAFGWANGAYGYGPVVDSNLSIPQTVVDGQWLQHYDGSLSISAKSTSVPDAATITWPTATQFDRLLIWSGIAWQHESNLVDFDVQTSVDGTIWVTQATVTKPTPTSFQFGGYDTGCQRETYWDEQGIFDVKLSAPVICKAIRLNVRATSFGGEPDAAAVDTGGQGSTQHIVLQEVVVLCDANTQVQPVLLAHLPE